MLKDSLYINGLRLVKRPASHPSHMLWNNFHVVAKIKEGILDEIDLKRWLKFEASGSKSLSWKSFGAYNFARLVSRSLTHSWAFAVFLDVPGVPDYQNFYRVRRSKIPGF